MKKSLLMSLAVAALAGSASATLYTDATNEVTVPGGPFPHLDIVSVDVTNTASTITFDFRLNGDIQSTSWGKYCLLIDTKAGGDTAGNPWGPRHVDMPTGADYWVGSWVDGGGGAQLWSYGGSWSQTASPSGTISQFNRSLTMNLSDLGLNLGDTFCFDALSTGGGGGDTATDLLSQASSSASNWGDWAHAGCLSYRVVPEPASVVAMMAGLGLTLIRRKRA